MGDFSSRQPAPQSGNAETAQPRESGVPTTGFVESPVYDGDAADATKGGAIPANRSTIH